MALQISSSACSIFSFFIFILYKLSKSFVLNKQSRIRYISESILNTFPVPVSIKNNALLVRKVFPNLNQFPFLLSIIFLYFSIFPFLFYYNYVLYCTFLSWVQNVNSLYDTLVFSIPLISLFSFSKFILIFFLLQKLNVQTFVLFFLTSISINKKLLQYV